MLIAEALDTLLTLGRWAIAWIAVLAFALTVILLGGSAVGAWAVRGTWRGVIRPSWAYGRRRARIYASHRVRRSSGRTDPTTYKEAA